jgi:hypothetical protein
MPIPQFGVLEAPNETTPLSFDGLATVDFKLIFPKLPMVNMFLHTMDIPTINVSPVQVATRFVTAKQIGEKISYQPFTITFLVDKSLYTYTEIYNWMKRMTVSGTAIGDTDNPYMMIGSKLITFVDAFPVSLDRLSFKANDDNTVYIEGAATFEYDYIEIK